MEEADLSKMVGFALAGPGKRGGNDGIRGVFGGGGVGMWICVFCGFLNMGRHGVCERCGQERRR